MNRYTMMVMMILWASARLAWADPDPPTTRGINVCVELRDHDGKPVPRVHIVVSCDKTYLNRPTDAQGQMCGALTIPTDLPRLIVVLSDLGTNVVGPEADADLAAYEIATRRSFFRQYYLIQLAASKRDYQLTIAGAPAVHVRGKVVDASGGPVESIVDGRDGLVDFLTIPAGSPFDVTCRRGQPAEVLVSTVNSPIVKVIEVPAAKTGEDVDLGNIVGPPIIGESGTLNCTMHNAAGVPPVPTAKSDTMTAISADGTVLVRIPVRFDKAVEKRISVAPPKLPPGTYYLLAGPPNYNRAAMGLRSLLRNGRAADVQAAGVSKVVITSGAQTDATLDAGATELAIWSLTPEQ